MTPTFWIIFLARITLFSCLPSVASKVSCDHYPNPTANLSTEWIDNDDSFSKNLVLFSVENSVILQCFDYPTDGLLSGQKTEAHILCRRQDWWQSDPPQVCYGNMPYVENRNEETSNAIFQNESQGLYIRKVENASPDRSITFQDADHYTSHYSVDPLTYSVSIKVQIAPTILGVIFVGIVIRIAFFVYRRRMERSEEIEEVYLDHVAGMPSRFSFQELAIATNNFNKKLGEGGFGSVFEGSFNDGTRIAVKRLNGVGCITKSFLAEVQSVGSTHHINLVRLIGFCAEKSHRLLVYAYMCNGSLERWIYCKSLEKMLEWKCRRNIILGIAKGLAYLHEDCLQKIIHLDIKPQNILLDECFNAKLGDFGLSKLIDRNQSNVVTTMRGTPGYLAPEWLKSSITEKVDVYSFGVVVLEIVSGRKIFVETRPEEERHLPTHFMKKAEAGQWLDLVDKCCLDVDSNVAEVEEMMQIAAWCLQSDSKKRPCMSVVIKILEGVNNLPNEMDYNLLISEIPQVSSKDATRLPPSLLSGPR